MTREEFSARLKELRRESGETVKKVCVALDCLHTDLYRIDNAKFNYGLERALKYADAISANVCVAISNKQCIDTHHVVLHNTQQIVDILTRARGDTTFSQVATDIGVVHSTVSRVEKGKCALTIDVFLKLADYYGMEVSIVPKQKQETTQNSGAGEYKD